MKFQTLLFSLGLLHLVASFDTTRSPGCVSKCWDNSKFVTICTKPTETECLCEDADFQGVVLQCLYSQCPTTQFGSALHHALAACSRAGMETLEVLPPLIRQQGLRKRGSQNTGYASGHLSASAIHSVARRSVKASALFSARPTRSIGRSPTHTYKSQSAISATPLASLTNAEFNYTKVPAQSTKTSWYVSEYPV